MKKSPEKRLFELLSFEHRDLGLVVIYGAAVGLLSLIVPVAAQSLVNSVVFTTLLQPLLLLSFVVFAMLGVASILRLIQTAVVERLHQRLFARISLDLAYRLSRVRIEIYDQSRGTELVNRFFEVTTIQKTTSLILLDGLSLILQAGIGLLLLAFYHPILLAFDLLLIFSIGLVLWLPLRKATLTSLKESQGKYRVAAWLEEIARNPIAFRFLGGGKYALQRADEETKQYLLDRRSHFRALIFQIGGTLFVYVIASALLLGVGSYLVIKEQLSLGQLVAAEIVVTMVASGFSKFGKYLESYYDLIASADKLGKLFDLPLETIGGEIQLSQPGPFSVELKKVTFAYPEKSTKVLSDTSIKIPSGSRIGIYGANGSGKSTFLDLVVGLRLPQSGAVTISEADLREISLERLREEIAFVGKPEVIDGSLLDNIRIGREHLGLQEVRAALSDVGLLEEISMLPEGLLTIISGTQSPLSRGQVDRLMIARAIVGKPKLLVIDETLDSMDDRKNSVMDVLFSSDAPWTVIVASHDSVDLARCDRVYELQGGKLLAMGPPQEAS